MQASIWQKLGTPDFRRARLLVEAYLPAHYRPHLPPKALEILTYLLLLCWRQGVGGSVHRGVHPSQRWLAEKIGCSRSWVWRLISRLRAAGLIETRRSYYRGHASVNLHYPGGMLFRMLHVAVGTKDKARPQPDDDLVESWARLCRKHGADPVRVLEEETER